VLEISFARHVKELGRLTTEELSVMFNKSGRSKVDKNGFVERLKELVAAADELEVENYEKKLKPKSKNRSTKKNITREVIT